MHMSFIIKYSASENNTGKIININFTENNNTFGNVNSNFNNIIILEMELLIY